MNLRPNTAKLAAAGLLVAAVVGGGASIAAAASPTSSTVSADQQQTDGEHADGPDGGAGSAQETADPTFTGTVRAPADTEQPGGQENSGSDGQEQAALQKLATVSQTQAERAAVGAVPGSVAETSLDAENGFVVYTVEITAADGTVTEVGVDAGNGSVLTKQAQNAGDPSDAAGQAGDQQN